LDSSYYLKVPWAEEYHVHDLKNDEGLIAFGMRLRFLVDRGAHDEISSSDRDFEEGRVIGALANRSVAAP